MPSQVGVPFATVGHGVHDDPQDAVAVFDAHEPLHSWKFASQALLQLPETHDAVAFGRVGQAVHEAPHAVGSVSDLQLAPHAWNLESHDVSQLPSLHSTEPFAGFAQSDFVRQPSLHFLSSVSQ